MRCLSNVRNWMFYFRTISGSLVGYFAMGPLFLVCYPVAYAIPVALLERPLRHYPYVYNLSHLAPLIPAVPAISVCPMVFPTAFISNVLKCWSVSYIVVVWLFCYIVCCLWVSPYLHLSFILGCAAPFSRRVVVFAVSFWGYGYMICV